VIVIAGRPQQAVHAGGGDDRQPPCGTFFITGRMLFLMPNRQCQSIEDSINVTETKLNIYKCTTTTTTSNPAYPGCPGKKGH